MIVIIWENYQHHFKNLLHQFERKTASKIQKRPIFVKKCPKTTKEVIVFGKSAVSKKTVFGKICHDLGLFT